jgi:hypothetical protein
LLIRILFSGVFSTGPVKVSNEMGNDDGCRDLKGRNHAISDERPKKALES